MIKDKGDLYNRKDIVTWNPSRHCLLEVFIITKVDLSSHNKEYIFNLPSVLSDYY